MDNKQTDEYHTEWNAKYFNSIMEDYEAGKLSEAETVIRGIQSLRIYLESRSSMFKKPMFRIGVLCKALDKTTLGSQRATLDEKFMEGCIIEGLVRFGSSKNQPYEFVSEWRGISPSSAKTSHALFNRKFGFIVNRKEDSFVSECCFWVMGLLADTEKVFPKQYPKASPAFSRLTEACKKMTVEIEKEEFPIYNSRPYEQL